MRGSARPDHSHMSILNGAHGSLAHVSPTHALSSTAAYYVTGAHPFYTSAPAVAYASAAGFYPAAVAGNYAIDPMSFYGR
jgi:hypothetical protein